MKREMVEVVLYKDGTYTVEDISPECATQRMWGMHHGKDCDIYHCFKSRWKEYLVKLLSTKDIDQKIAELRRQKKAKEELKAKILKEIEAEVEHEQKK